MEEVVVLVVVAMEVQLVDGDVHYIGIKVAAQLMLKDGRYMDGFIQEEMVVMEEAMEIVELQVKMYQ